MRPVLRRAIPVLTAALALANAGCGGSKPSESSPTSPAAAERPVAAGGARVSAQGVSAKASTPSLGAAGPFGVLGASTVTNTGATTVNGDLGIRPGLSCTGFQAPCIGGGPGIVTGVIHAGDATALAAQTRMVTVYNNLAGQACTMVLTGTDLGGLTLGPGVYCFSSSAQLTGALTLDGGGNPSAAWVFQIGTTLTTAVGSSVNFINSGRACGAFWQVGSSATLGTTTNFAGNVVALASITLNNSANSDGALFARTGAVTLDTNTVNVVGSCGAAAPVPALPHAAAWGLFAILLACGVFVLGRR